MRQRSLENLMHPVPGPMRYAYGFYFLVGTNGEIETPSFSTLLEYSQQRFEVWNICVVERGDKEHKWHMQCYGETQQPHEKSERQMFQGNGRYRKHLDNSVRKCWWFGSARKERHNNVMYVLKDVKTNGLEDMVCKMNPQHPREDLLNWVDEAHELFHSNEPPPEDKAPRNFQERLFMWYKDKPVEERPTDIMALIELMIREKQVPWQNLPERSLVSAAEAVLLNCTTGDVYDRILTVKMAKVKIYYEQGLGNIAY